jgi:uncharacterized membrane protein YhhN
VIGAIVCAVSVAALLLAEWKEWRPGVAVAKPLASAGFLLAAFELGALESAYGRCIAVGLLLCAAGDVLLIPRQRPKAFQAGIASFLLGHVAYTAGFWQLGPHAATLVASALAMAGFAWVVLRWLGPHLPDDFRGPVRAYVAVISAMVACSLAAVAGGATAAVAVGAIGFAASDLAVARDRFVAPGFRNGAWGLPLYYASQLVIATTTPAA